MSHRLSTVQHSQGSAWEGLTVHTTEQRMVTGDELDISREKHPKPDTILGIPHGLELPEKFPTPKTRTSLHLITTPDLLPDNNSVFQPHPKADWMSVPFLSNEGSPSPYQSHKHEFPEPADFQLEIPLVHLLRELCSSPGAALEDPTGTAIKPSRPQF